MILDMIKQGKKFRLLIINPAPKAGDPKFFEDSQGKIIHYGLVPIPKGTLERFKHGIVVKLAEDEKTRFDVREYNLPITHTMIVIDPNSPDAKIHFEVLHYVAVEGTQPVFVIERAKDSVVFQNLIKSFENAYDKATPIDWKNVE